MFAHCMDICKASVTGRGEARTLTTIDIGHLLAILCVNVSDEFVWPAKCNSRCASRWKNTVYGCLSVAWERAIFMILILIASLVSSHQWQVHKHRHESPSYTCEIGEERKEERERKKKKMLLKCMFK